MSNKLSLDSLLTESQDNAQETVITESVVETSIPNIDLGAILREWSYRCDSGYPVYGKDKDMIHLQNILDENHIPLPFDRIVEAPKVVTPAHSIFNADYLNVLYPKHSRAIMDAFRTYGSKSKNLNLFGKSATLTDLLKVISDNTTDPLFKELYKISSVSGAEGGESETSGRGGLGKGEVLSVLLTKGGTSGGTSGTDLDSVDGSVQAEIKGGIAKNFKVPLAASRIKSFNSQKELRRFFALIEDVKDMDEYPKFLELIQNELGDTQMKLQDGVYFGKKPTPSDINMTEYANLRKFFIGCHKYFYKSKSNNDDNLYINIDSPTGVDALLYGKLKSPSSVDAIKSNSKVTINVVTKDEDAVREFKMFEHKLKNHAYVKQLNQLDVDAAADLNTLLANKYIIFHEPSKGVLPKPIMINSTESKHKPKVLGYTLNQVIVGFQP
jgi:hypothetical protein